MKFNINKLALGVSLGLSTVLISSSVFALLEDDLGDNAVHFPKNDSILSSGTTDVWFASTKGAAGTTDNNKADGYLLHIAKYATIDDTCGTAGSEEAEYRYYIPAGEASCDNDSVATAGVTGDYSAHDSHSNLKLCKWTTPEELADGFYALGVSAVTFGVELGGTDKSANVLAGTGCGDDGKIAGTSSVTAEDYNTDTVGIPGSNYNVFSIDSGAAAGITQAPSKLVITTPEWNATGTNDNDLDFTGTDDLTFKDYSPVEGKANWYEVYVLNSDTGDRLVLNDDNTNATYWYKIGVDGVVADASGDGTDGAGDYKGFILALVEATVAPTSGDVMRIWVRAWNDEFGAGPWSDEVRIQSD